MVSYIVALACAFLTVDGDINTSYIQEMNLVYGETHGIGLLMDVFKPKSESNGRAIVDIVSSAGNTERINVVQHTHWRIYEVLCAHGYTVFAIRPGSSSKWPIWDVREHVRTGIRYVQLHANEYGIEPELLGIIGVSAGGYLTCLTAVTPVEGDPNAEDPLKRYSTRVAAAAPICPGTGGWIRDLGEGDEYLKVAKRFGIPLDPKPTREEVLKRVAEFSPIAMVRSDSPPFLFTHATGDPIVSFANSENMVKALKEVNVDVELRAIDSKEHVWDATIPADIEVIASWFDKKLDANTSYIQKTDVVYGEPNGIGLLMDVFKPKGKPNGRIIVDIVSSAGNTERFNIVQHTQWSIYEILCAHGYTVFAIRPGSSSKWSIQERQEHIRMGIRYVKWHAEEYGAQPEPLGILGVSSGGYLTCLTALTPIEAEPGSMDPLRWHGTRVAAAAPICPPTDLRGRNLGEGDEYLKTAEWLGMSLEPKPAKEEVAKKLAEFSPVCLVGPDCPAFLFTHATGDPIVPFENSEKMVKALKKVDADVELRAIDSDEHVWAATIPADIEAIASWFDRTLEVENKKVRGGRVD